MTKLIKASAAALAIALSGAASATVQLDTGANAQYTVVSSSSAVANTSNEYTFTYSVTNDNQSTGGQTGLDGFTIFVPDSAILVGSTHPLPATGAEHAPGYWSEGAGPALNLLGNGSQNLSAPTGYHAYTWWGQDPASVYGVGGNASFSITLANVAVGNNTVGVSSYFGFSTPAQAYASNQWGNYTTFTSNAVSAVSAVPEPESYAMLLAGLGLMGCVARRKKSA